jgi:hypothetical protein
VLLRSGGECRQGQEVCGEVQQTPCIRSKQLVRGWRYFRCSSPLLPLIWLRISPPGQRVLWTFT